jgi:hypothetical protein
MMDEMVQTDSSFDKNRKRYDPFFGIPMALLDFEFLSMNCDCLKIEVTIDFTCKKVG